MSVDLNTEPTTDNIGDFINVIEDHRKNCDIEGKYVEA